MSSGIGSAGRARTLRTYGRTRVAVEVIPAEIEGVLGTGGTADAMGLTDVDGEVVNDTAAIGTAAGGPGTAVKEVTISNALSSGSVRFIPTDDLAWAPVATSPYHGSV